MKYPTWIDSTSLSNITCQAKAQFAVLERLEGKTKSIHLHAGGAFASGLEAARNAFFVLEMSHKDSIIEGFKALTLEYGDEDWDKEAKSWEGMVGALVFYFDVYPMDKDEIKPFIIEGKATVEFSFSLPIPDTVNPDTGEPILFCGRADMIGEYRGALYNVDEKTTGSMGGNWANQWNLRPQFLGYAWANRELGIKTAGTIVRGIGIYKTDPRYRNAEAIVYHPDWKMERWLKQTQHKLRTLTKIYKTGDFLFDYSDLCNSYGGCPYRTLCEARNPDDWKEIHFQKSEWNPLKSKKKHWEK